MARRRSSTTGETPLNQPAHALQRVLPAGPVTLAHADVGSLTVFENPRDLRRDLHVFLEYVGSHSIKRSVRGNNLPRADVARLSKLLNDPEPAAGTHYADRMRWLDFVDHLAHRLGLTTYNTTGVYIGYSSTEPSFPDNYMAVAATAYRDFLALPLAEQEHRLVAKLTEDYRPDQYSRPVCEFYTPGVLGRLDVFPLWGSATGVMEKLEFAPARRFLLEILARCEPGVWLSTASLVAYLKEAHPHFLIPPGPLKTRWGQPTPRFQCFNESVGNPYSQGDSIPDDAPDAFERIEGRYVERFLEGIPLVLGYVDVAYGENRDPHRFPSRDVLRAFRVKERLIRSLTGQIAEPTITVQPNLEIYIQSEVYPAHILAQLTPLADVTTNDAATILKLQREKVAAALTQNERLNVVQFLEKLSGRPLPQNVVRELREWTEHSSKFTLYVNYGIWEGDPTQSGLAAFQTYCDEEIGPHLRLTHKPMGLMADLERAGRMPMWIKHGDAAFAHIPAGAQTIFRRKTPAPAAPVEKPLVELRREVQITLHLPTEELWERVRKALADARCSIASDRASRTITYQRRYEPQVQATLTALETAYRLQIVDLE